MNWNKTSRKIFTIFLLIIQVTFLFFIFKEHLHSLWVVLLMLCVLVLTTYLTGRLHHKAHAYEHVLVALWIPVGALISFYLNHFLSFGPVISVGIIGNIASFIPGLKRQVT